jgi:hypothetical protein
LLFDGIAEETPVKVWCKSSAPPVGKGARNPAQWRDTDAIVVLGRRSRSGGALPVDGDTPDEGTPNTSKAGHDRPEITHADGRKSWFARRGLVIVEVEVDSEAGNWAVCWRVT